jgi:phosphoesterase RecJ-like protein
VFDLVKYTKELSELLESSDNILLISHINPDGDAIGSQLALYHYLRYKGKSVSMMCPNNLQEFLKWMDGSEKINVFIRHRKRSIKLIEEAKLIIMVDFNQPGRLGEAEKAVTSSHAPKSLLTIILNLITLLICSFLILRCAQPRSLFMKLFRSSGTDLS